MKPSKMQRLYDALVAQQATSQANALTAHELHGRGAHVGMSMHHLSTYLAQMATTKRGVLARELVEVNPGEPRRYRYWVTGPYTGRRAPKPAAKPTPRARANGQANGHTSGQGRYKLSVDGDEFILERVIDSEQLNRLMGVLLQPNQR